MSIEDRVRAATRARSDLVRSVRPLEFPAQAPAPARRDRSRRWLNWGAPIAAAALVTALALTLALLRQADGPQPGHVTPAASRPPWRRSPGTTWPWPTPSAPTRS